LLVGTETGLCLLDRYTLEYRTFSEQNSAMLNEVVKTIHARDPSQIYFGTDKGFYRLNLETGVIDPFLHNPFNRYSITNNEVWKVGSDRNGDLWLATSNGISRVNLEDQPFKYYPVYSSELPEPVGTRVSDVVQDRQGRWWVASSSGVYFADGEPGSGMTFSRDRGMMPLSIENINAISVDGKNRIWIGSVAGVNIWDPSTKKRHLPAMDQVSASRVASNYISAIFPGTDDQMWIGTWGGGLYVADGGEELLDHIDIQYIADLNGQMVQGYDHIWALDGQATYRFSFNTSRVEEITAVREAVKDGVLTCHCYSEKKCLWIGSKNQLFRYDIESDRVERVPMPIDEDFIVTGLIEDDRGYIWGCSSNTIFRFDPVEGTFHYYPVPEGIPLKKLVLAPFRRAGDGDILACGFDGFLKFDPRQFPPPGDNRKVRITSLKVNGEQVQPNLELSGRIILRQIISGTDEITLPYRQRNISLEYSSFRYSQIEHEQYAFLLEGYEDEWKVTEPGTNTASYVNLPPGKYSFRIKLYAAEGTELISSLAIKVMLPLWASPPFLAAYILILLGILWIIFSQYRTQIKFRTQVSMIQMEKEQSDRLNAAKIRFFVNISHELLNSLGLILDPLKKLLSTRELDAGVRNTLGMIEKNAYFLKVYVDQLLNFRKIEIGQHTRRTEETLELIGFCRQAVTFFKGKATAREILLKFKADRRQLFMETDGEKLYSILQNLLSNAIKFTPQGGSVTLQVRQTAADEIMLEVKDTGIGIAEAEQEKIFDRFYQVTAGPNESGGIGIGLTIVREFVQVLDGRLELKSRPGEGASFRVFLPMQAEKAADSDRGMISEDIVSRKSLEAVEEDPAVYRGYVASDLPVILLVDENRDQFEYMRQTMQSRYNVLWSPTVSGALSAINKLPPSLIISEVWLPDKDGLALCRKIRKNLKTEGIPFMILTSRNDANLRLDAAEAGVDAYLLKPLDLDVLEANISTHLGRVRRMEAHLQRRLLMNAREVEPDSSGDRLLKEVVEYIHLHMTNSRITAEEISHAVGISHSSLYRKIKGMTGQSLSEFIRYIRLQKAEQLLSGSKLSVSEVMYRVGFTNHSYFSKCFRQLFNVTPGDYLKKNNPT
jgi:signal transduction histidine kinase/AraC-like DNA-binding protein/CheY-like chemotaxis protein/streptogramin lyase